MSSYYHRIFGHLAPAEIARSEDIHSIQTEIQSSFRKIAQDIFGEGCILDDDEEALKITPIPFHVDQQNKNYDEESSFISFYDIYLKQKINIEKSEIQSIRLQIKNDSILSPTIFAEIRDSDMNLIKESNVVLESTIDQDPANIDFIFNLEHLPVGEYYFILRPVDITSTDLAQNGDETIYDIITADMFLVRYDRGGNYNEGLQASYNGVNYLDANLLDEDITVNDNNFDLYFEHVFSAGNTYVVNPANCLVMGEPVYPIDTHITIDGPSKTGNRIDLVTLTTDGLLNVTSGLPYTGEKEEKHYPINTSGFKIAYITTYQNSNAFWTCPTCGTVNDGHIQNCYNCSTSTNSRIPLIEQADDNGVTRQRDILERLRRLENKIEYQVENNTPSRIKYTCTTDPTMAVGSSKNNDWYNEDSYKVSSKNNTSGENIISFDDDKKETYAWSIVDKITTTKISKTQQYAYLEAQYVSIPTKKPKNPTSSQYFNVNVYTVNNDTDTTYSEFSAGVSIPLTIYIKNQKGKILKTIEKETNLKGKLQLDLWQYKLSTGTYTIITKYQDKKLSTTLKVCDNCTIDNKKKGINIIISETVSNSANSNVNIGTITGNDSFYTNNMTVDTTNGEVYITKTTISNPEKTTWSTITKQEKESLQSSKQNFNISNSSESLSATYGMLNFEIKNDCTIYNITPHIENFTNIKDFKIILFENDKIFSYNRTKTSYIKELDDDRAINTNFPNIYSSEWIEVDGTANKDTITPKEQHTFNLGKKGIEISKGIYSLLIIGRLKEKRKEGKITIKQYHVSNAEKYGAVSTTEGSINPNKVFFNNYSLTNRTWYVTMDIYEHQYNSTGILVSKTINTVNNIQSCKMTANYEIPAGCDVDTYVSNNGGKSYILVGNNTDDKNKATFKGLGHEFRWRIVFHGTTSVTPKLKFSDDAKMKCAIKFELSEVENFIDYEDYDRCFATPLFNANAITRLLAQNQNIQNQFEEWEFCRLWMEDEDLAANIDICFAYDYDNYTTNVGTKQPSWPNTLFFSQTLSNLNIKDFSQTSIDYSNYGTDIEYDENNYHFKFDTKLYNENDITIATPLASLRNAQYNYNYGDITNEYIDMSNFDYGLMNVPYVYSDNYDEDDDSETKDINNIYKGTYIVAGPYFQAMYNPKNIEGNAVWAADSGIGDYNEQACIIGVSFENGLEITDEYTQLKFDIFPNLRDCMESDIETGKLELDETTGKAVLNENRTIDSTKYIDETTGYYYIPENTLEIVASLNPYGLIEDDNATYGKAYPITVPLRSCKHTTVSINLSDLYGYTIYSFGIRIRTAKDNNGEPAIHEDENNKHPSLHKGDILGLGNISFEAFNVKSYCPYIYTGDTSRWNWMAINKNQNSFASILYASKDDNDDNTRYAKIIIPRNKDPNETYTCYSPSNPNATDPSDFEWYRRGNVTTLTKANDSNLSYKQVRTKNSNRIQIKNGNTLVRTSNDTANTIVFHINSADKTGNLFKINTDINLSAYHWVNIKYHLELIKTITTTHATPEELKTFFETGDQISKGDIIFDFYNVDADNIIGATPVESFALPAWGKIQEQYGNGKTDYPNKTVNAWFKIHTDASSLKCIVLRRENPTKRDMANVNLVLQDIVFLNTNTVPALGPQMHVRIYPKNMTTRNTKIRKVGCVYRIG